MNSNDTITHGFDTVTSSKYIKLFLSDWQTDFIKRTKETVNSKNLNFTYSDAVKKSEAFRTTFDDLMIEYLDFINSDPLRNNDYFKYFNSYVLGKKLNEKFFKHDLKKLAEYYKKFDENNCFNPFLINRYNDYVLFMMLKLKGFYIAEYDVMFNVIYKDNREYNPLTSMPSVLRGEIPFKVIEYDIVRAFYTFLCIELNIAADLDVYGLISKQKFNTLLNLFKGCSNSTIESVRRQLVRVFGERANDVMTDQRFNAKGKMFLDLTFYENQFIESFVKANDLKHFVRLHDGIFVLSNVQCDVLEFGKVIFSIKECIKPTILNECENFYSYGENGGFVTSHSQYANFFKQENFIRVSEDGNDTITLLKNTNNVLIPHNHKTDIVSFLKEYINEYYTKTLENIIAKECLNVIQQSYFLIDPLPLIYYRDTKNSFGIAFKNGFVEQNFLDVIVKDYKDVNGFFAPHSTQDFEYIFNENESVFSVFLAMVSTGKDPRNETLTKENLKTFHDFKCMFGFMVHKYKDEAFCPAIILSDAGANDLTRNGGRGKSLITQAISKVRNVMLKAGSEFDTEYLFIFSDLKKMHDVYIIDDVFAGFKFNSLYTQISGGINCQLKGRPAQLIPFKESPKFIITTNWSYRVEDNSTSTQRRFFEYQLTDFFNLERTPQSVFGHVFFEDWNTDEWNRFYSFCFECVELYLDNGLQRIEYDKTQDNFRASFNNDVMLNEMERIMNELLMQDSFTASDFMAIFKRYDSEFRYDNLFTHKNVKHLIDTYIKHHKIELIYTNRKKWTKSKS